MQKLQRKEGQIRSYKDKKFHGGKTAANGQCDTYKHKLNCLFNI